MPRSACWLLVQSSLADGALDAGLGRCRWADGRVVEASRLKIIVWMPVRVGHVPKQSRYRVKLVRVADTARRKTPTPTHSKTGRPW